MDHSKLRKLGTYEILSQEKLSDIHAEGILLRHKKSGARVMLIPAEDENKVFNIAFRTPPEDSTGVAHIIEHTVLCGSREFPMKDPFVELVKGSLNTFLNAMTYPDKTMYPVASTNDADFRNLMHVYLDAVFFPNIYREENIFRQEGWSYRIDKPEDSIAINGVVYNEMKGVFSSPDEFLDRVTFNALFPDTPYGVESGGDPEVIPTLTYEKFLEFHKKYYHPSNSYIYLYGNLDMAETLRWMDEKYLSGFDYKEIDSAIRIQKPFRTMKRVTEDYPVSDEDPIKSNTYLSYNVVAGNPLDIKECIAFDVLDYALLSAPGAPVKQALLDRKIGNDVYGGYNDGILQPYFSVTSKNARTGDEKEFLDTIRTELTKQADNGIDRQSLIAGINYLEFQFREADFATFPKGLMYSIDAFDSWLYDESAPFTALKQLDAYAALRQDAENGYFENLIKTKLLNNPHSAVIILKPKKGLTKKKEEIISSKLEAYKASLSAGQLRTLIDETEALREYQEAPEKPEDIARIPLLQRSDIKRETRKLSNIVRHIQLSSEHGDAVSLKTVYHDAETNGIAYTELFWDIRQIPENLIPMLGVLKSVLVNVNTEHYGYSQLNNEINANTGGISCGVSEYDDPKNPDGYLAFFSIRCKSLYGKLDFAFRMIREIITTSDFSDEKRIYEILASLKSQLQVAIQQTGHAVASTRAEAYYSSGAAFNDLVGGIAFYKYVKDLEEHYEEKKAGIREMLSELLLQVFDPQKMMISYTSEKAGRPLLCENAGILTKTLTAESAKQKIVQVSPLGRLNEGFITAGQVQYAAAAGSFRKEGIAYTGAMQIFRQIMSYDYLWKSIRVKGGAYGCSAALKKDGDGIFASFRDPHLKQTFEVYRSVPAYLRSFHADDAEMTKYIIGTISGMDTPLSPSLYGSYCMRAYLSHISEKDMQKTRDEVLSAGEDTIRALAPAAEAVLKEGYLCVIGSREAILRDSDIFLATEVLL